MLGSVAGRIIVALAAVVGSNPAQRAKAQSCPAHAGATTTGTVASNALVEASGIAASRRNPGVLWSHNDSGGSNNVFALGLEGADLGTFTLSGTTAVDWEDIAIGPGPVSGTDYIYVADTGDNFNIRPNVKVYRVPEPTVTPSAPAGNVTLSGAQAITLVYPDGPRDAETLMVDINSDIYIVTKRVSAHGRVYRAAFPQATSGTITLQYVGEIPWGAVNGNGGATGGDIAHDGSAVIVRRASGFLPAATLWRRAPGTNLADVFAQPGCDVAMPSEPQGEAIGFSPHDLSLYSISEGSHQPIHFAPQVYAPGDLNGDDIVNIADLLAVITTWGPCPRPPLPCAGDADDSSTVDVNDLLLVITNWD